MSAEKLNAEAAAKGTVKWRERLKEAIGKDTVYGDFNPYDSSFLTQVCGHLRNLAGELEECKRWRTQIKGNYILDSLPMICYSICRK